MAITLPSDLVTDVRDPVAGESYGWAGVEPAAAKKSIVIHHSASRADAPGLEDAFSIARYHVGTNGWGGIGYHFVITHDKDGSPQIQYAGDLLTYRAHVLNNNPGRVGICLAGNFEVELPGEQQLRLARRLIDFLLAPNGILPSLNYYSQVVGHGDLMSTGCPGKIGPGFNEWFNYLKGGPEPSWWAVRAEDAIAVLDGNLELHADNRPEWERSWTPSPDTPKVVNVPSADVFDFALNAPVAKLPGGTMINNIAGYFTVNNQLYARTQWAVDNNKWNGILVSELKNPEPKPVDTITAPEPPGSILADPPYEEPIKPEPPVIPPSQPASMGFWSALVVLIVRLLGKIKHIKVWR